MGEADEYMDQEAQRGNPQYKLNDYQQNNGYQQSGYQQNNGYQQSGYQQDNSYQQNAQNQNSGQYQQQPSQGPYGPPPAYSFNPPIQNEKYTFEDAFKIEKPVTHDIYAGIALVGVFGGFVAISIIVLNAYRETYGFNGGDIYDGQNNFSLNTNTVILFIFCLVVAVVFSYAYVWTARLFTKQFIWITGILNIVFAFGTAIFYLIEKYYSAGVVFLIFGVFLCFAFWTWIPRIPFSTLMLKTSIDVSKKYGHVYLVSFVGGIFATALAAWYSVTLVAIYIKYNLTEGNPNCNAAGGGCASGTVIGLIFYCTFAMYWASEWLKNTIHTIISGVYGAWYFSPNNFPRDATRQSAKRALTYSFGSVSLGSLLIAIIQFLRQLCSIAQSQAGSDGGIGGAIGYAMFCVLGCLISILEWAVSFLNRYAFTHIALYGKSYFEAAKDTWKMIKDRGIDALVNECLVGPVLSFGAMFIGYACALLAYLYLRFTDPAYNRDGGYTPVIVAFAFLIGFQIAHVFTTPLSSGIDTIFVAAGWDPQVLRNEHPELWQDMVQVYPKVQQAIRDR